MFYVFLVIMSLAASTRAFSEMFNLSYHQKRI